MNINDLLIYGRKYLMDTSITEAPLKIRLLAEHVLGLSKYELVIQHTKEVSNIEFEEFKNGLEKIKRNIPIQYIIHKQEFMKLNFYVDENVLIPQPDTEILVEEVLSYCSNYYSASSTNSSTSSSADSNRKIKILDLCTGSGAIAISLAKYIDNCEVVASDISFKAIQIAKLNAEKNLVHRKINFIESNMFDNIDLTDFDIIVSNPPYIESTVIPSLSAEVQNEPIIALDGGIDGLFFYKIIVKNSYSHLKNHGKLFLEIGYNQKETVSNLINSSNNYCNLQCIQDLGSNDRVLICEKNS